MAPPPVGERGPMITRRELGAVTLVLASLVVPFGLGAILGPLPYDVPLEPRVAWVVGLASAIALGAWVIVREGDGRRRLAPLALLFVPVGHVVLSTSSIPAALDGALFVLVSFGVVARVQWRAIASRRSRSAIRTASAVAACGVVHVSIVLVALGVISCVVIPSIARVAHPTPALEGDERAIEILTEDGLTLRATYLPGEASAPAIVLAHGRGDGRDRMLGWARELNARGAHVIAYDGRAHAASDGAVVTFADREPRDVVRVLDALLAHSGADVSAVALMGESMGGGAVLAALGELDRRGVRRVVLLAPASDYDALVGAYMPPGPFRTPSRAIVRVVSTAMGFTAPFDQMPREALRDAPHVDVLVFHPRGDRTIPLALSERLVLEHPSVRLRIVERGGHDGLGSRLREDTNEHDVILEALGLGPSG